MYYPWGYRHYHAPYFVYGPRYRYWLHYGYWPYYAYWPHYVYWPTYGYGYYAGPSAYAPATSERVAPRPPPPRSRFGVAGHLGQLQRDDGEVAGFGGIAVRWRGPTVEAELELGRRVYPDNDLRERSLAATLYVNLGRRDALHPYLLGGVGLLGSDRAFGAVGGGIAIPFATRFTIAGDLRAAAIRARDDEMPKQDLDASTLEGRVTAIVDF